MVNFGQQVTLAHLKEKSSPSTPNSSSSFSSTGGVRSAAARLLGGGNGSRALSFAGNGGSKSLSAASKIGSLGAASSSNSIASSNFDGKGSYLIFNVGDAIFISDLNSQEKVIHIFLFMMLNVWVS